MHSEGLAQRPLRSGRLRKHKRSAPSSLCVFMVLFMLHPDIVLGQECLLLLVVQSASRIFVLTQKACFQCKSNVCISCLKNSNAILICSRSLKGNM